MLYREMELSKKLPDMPEDEQYALLATNGMLVSALAHHRRHRHPRLQGNRLGRGARA